MVWAKPEGVGEVTPVTFSQATVWLASEKRLYAKNWVAEADN